MKTKDLLLQPISAYLVRETLAQQVIAPPYDVLARDEARKIACDKPFNILHITKPEIDLPDHTPIDDASIYAQAKSAWQTFKASNVFEKTTPATFYVYELSTPQHEQIGLMGSLNLDPEKQKNILTHEATRLDKEIDRTHHLQAIQAAISPILLTYPEEKNLQNLLSQYKNKKPDRQASTPDGTQHRLWIINNDDCSQIIYYLKNIENLYVADGHHRLAAAQAYNQNNPKQPGVLLAAIFADQQLKILGYHRLLKSIAPSTISELLSLAEAHFTVKTMAKAQLPTQAGTFHLYAKQQWWQLSLREKNTTHPLKSLDVWQLHEKFLQPFLHIHDERCDPRIKFLANSAEKLQQVVDENNADLAIAVYPTELSDLFNVANAHVNMPPKSTWFEPKLVDGLLVYPFS